MKEFIVYTALRIGLFVAFFAVLLGAWDLAFGLDSTTLVVIVVVAATGSSVLSLRLLRGPRNALALRVNARAEAATNAYAQMRAKEDADHQP